MTRRRIFVASTGWMPLGLLLLVAIFLTFSSLAADAAPVDGPPLDLTGIATSLIAGVFAVLGIILPILINNWIKDGQASAALAAAVKNSLGAAEQAATAAVTSLDPKVTLPGVPASLTVPVQYVLDHAGDEAARFNITPADIASKINAQIGLAKIAAALPTSVISGQSTSAISKLAIMTIPALPATVAST